MSAEVLNNESKSILTYLVVYNILAGANTLFRLGLLDLKRLLMRVPIQVVSKPAIPLGDCSAHRQGSSRVGRGERPRDPNRQQEALFCLVINRAGEEAEAGRTDLKSCFELYVSLLRSRN